MKRSVEVRFRWDGPEQRAIDWAAQLAKAEIAARPHPHRDAQEDH